MTKVAIIGSGAAAAAAHMGLRNSSASIKIVLVCAMNTQGSKFLRVEDEFKLPASKVARDVISPGVRPFVQSNLAGELFGSTAHGGWTEYWGATMLPWHQNSLKNFHSYQVDLLDAYRSILDYVPVMAEEDELTPLFPLYGKNVSSKRGTALHEALKSRNLSKIGFFAGNSRLAIRRESTDILNGCTHCGSCLQGCPGSNIWSAKHYFDKYSTSETINLLVDKIVVGEKISIHGFDEKQGNQIIEGFDRVILAAGAISSSSILIKSKLVSEVRIKDSPMTLVPFFIVGRRKKSKLERITLAEAFIVSNPDLARSGQMFMQCYDMNSYIVEKIRNFNVILKLLSSNALNYILRYFSVAMIFQDSVLGGEVLVHQDKDGKVLVDESKTRTQSSKRILRKYLFKLMKCGVIFLWPFRQFAETAQGFHFGHGSLLGRDHLAVTISLTDGALSNSERVHVLDSLALPAIPCFPTTYTLMANAFRMAANMAKKVEG